MPAWHPDFVESAPSEREAVVRFAASQSDHPLRLELRVVDTAQPPTFTLTGPNGVQIEPSQPLGDGEFLVVLTVDPSPVLDRDDEILVELREATDAVPPCRAHLRRSTCRLDDALIDGGISEQTRAALLWYGWDRYTEMVGLKRFTGGRSGSQVLVVRPRLRRPATDHTPAGGHLGDLLADSWGSWLLVKTGDRGDVAQEWDRFQLFLRDRLHPFLARTEAYLPIRLAVGSEPGQAKRPAQATVISTFIGGDLVQAEALDVLLLTEDDPAVGERRLDQVFAVLAPWHATGADRPLGDWRRVLRTEGDRLLLFNRYDFRDEEQRHSFIQGLRWEEHFIRREHLQHHLLGKGGRPGLLDALRAIPARFGLTHGDLNPRNVLCAEGNVWLIDFEHVGIGPVLADFARLEANLRLWCLPLAPAGEDATTAAEELERHLFDHLHGSEGGLSRLRRLAPALGAEPDRLLAIARCIARIRQRAAASCVRDFTDRRDYLAVLYLTCLSLLRVAHRDGAAPVANYRWLMSLAWVLEEKLDRLLGRQPYPRAVASTPRGLIGPDWIAAPGAPGRVHYALGRDDGRRALPEVAALRGVLQGRAHHLDTYEHTLLVLATVEGLLDDPTAGFLDPAGLQKRVGESLRRQGVPLPWGDDPADSPGPTVAPPVLAERLATLWPCVLNVDARLLVKWSALLHDVGKPALRRASDGQVQFHGHAEYGAELLRPLLDHLFAGQPDLRRRLADLIVRHHTHHQLLSDLEQAGPGRRDEYLAGLREGVYSRDMAKYLNARMRPRWEDDAHAEVDFVLLVLHGFADRLASRGPCPQLSVAEVALLDLAVLRYCAEPAQRQERDERDRQEARLWSAIARRLRATCREWNLNWRQVGTPVMGELRGRAWPDGELSEDDLVRVGQQLLRQRVPDRPAQAGPLDGHG